MTEQPGSFNPYGAIDLAALAKQREAQERAAAIAADPESAGALPAVIDVTDVTFEADVVQRSMTVPIVIDFWATWCGPCKQLSPILERFAESDGGRWVLAKIDVDANQQLAAAAQVQSVPTVMVVWQGQVIPGFAGALPEAQVRDFLNQVLALADGQPAAEAPEADEPEDPEITAADAAVEAGDWDAATAAYERVLQTNPDDVEAREGLVRVDLLRRTEGHTLATAVAEAAEHPDDVPAQARAADLELLAGEVDAAFDRLIALVSQSSGEPREQAKMHLVGLLDLVGNEDPRVLEARRRLASALF